MIHVFIVNPYAGLKTFADDLRTTIQNFTSDNCFIFNTRYAGHESSLIKFILDIFDNEKLRIYCCGGSGTIRNILSGIDDFSNVEIAFFPCGLTNDFLKIFGEQQQRFHDIKELINGEVLDIDYLETNLGPAINSVSFGLDPEAVKISEYFRSALILGTTIPYSIGILISFITERNQEYTITIDDNTHTQKITEAFVGSGTTLGGALHFFENNDVTDGIFKYNIIPSASLLKSIEFFKALIHNNRNFIDKNCLIGSVKHITISRSDKSLFSANLDGELIQNISELDIKIVQKGIHFIVPRGVTL